MFAPASEDGLVLRVKHGYGGLGENEGVVGISGRVNADKGVHEGWEYVAFGGGCGELWECESALSGGLLDLPVAVPTQIMGRMG